MLQKISDSELEIMEAIWSLSPPVSSAQIAQGLSDKQWKPTTILTFLSRLCDKGMLRAQKQGKANLWSPVVSKEDYVKLETESFLNQIHGGSVRSFLASLADDSLDEKDINELKEWFDKRI